MTVKSLEQVVVFHAPADNVEIVCNIIPMEVSEVKSTRA
jgi:hypothetical protein